MGIAASVSAMKKAPLLAIVGFSNSGKTTLMEKLITALSTQGLKVGSIKHSHHQPEMDTVGKDSWRHKQAGAVTSLLVGPEKMLMVRDLAVQPTPRQLVDDYFSGYDLVLLEGYASMPCPKIEVVREQRSLALRCADDDNLIAVVTDVNNLEVGVPRLDLNDISHLLAFVLKWLEVAKHG